MIDAASPDELARSEAREPAAGEQGVERIAAGRRFPFMAAAAVLILVCGSLVAVLARPAVSTFDLQRRDRLPPSARFVPFAYGFLLNRGPDPEGLATYQRMFDERGPEAVAVAIVQSKEFQDRFATPEGKALDAAPAASAQALAQQVVSAYEAGLTEQMAPADLPGRVGFVLVIGLCLLAIGWLRARARGAPTSDTPVYVPAPYLVGLFAVLAFMSWASTDLLIGSFGRASRWVYIEWLAQVTAAAAAFGPTNVWTPYPQGAQDLLIGLQVLARIVATWVVSDIWTEFTVFRILFQWVFLLVPSVLTVLVVSKLGRFISPSTATLAALGAAFSVAPMYYGFMQAHVMEPLPVLLGLVALLCLIRGRYSLAGCAIGVGAVLKLFPLLLLPVALIYLRSWRARLAVTIPAALVILVTFLPPALSNFDIFLSPIRWQSGRPPWESWFAFANWVLSAPHEYRSAYFVDISVGDAFGWVFWGITPRIAALLTPVPGAPIRWESLVSLAGTLATLGLCLAANSRSVLALLRWSLFALAAFMFWSLGWSPQYELYLIPLILLAVRPASIGLGAALLLEGLTLLEYPVLLPWAYFYGGSVVWLMWAALLGRYLVLGWLCMYVVQTEASLSALLSRLRRVGTSLASISAALVLGACTAAPGGQQPIVVTRAPDPPAGAAPTPVRTVPLGTGLTSAAVAGGQIPAPSTCAGGGRRAPAQVAELGSTEMDWEVPAGHFYSQAGERPNAGYALYDDDDARFWSEFQRLGGWPVLGYPATRRFTWHSSLSQATQRAVLQWSPLTGQVEFANMLDLMHEQGLDDALLQLKQIPPPADVDEAGLPYETIAGLRLKWLDDRPAIRQKYCDAPGGADPLVLWGLPTSRAVNMGTAGAVYVVRTQRAAFQEWVDGAPWAAPGEVTVVLAGDLAKEFNLLPADSMVPEVAPAH